MMDMHLIMMVVQTVMMVIIRLSFSTQEICDGQVNTCGGSLPVNEIDNDNDGYVECALIPMVGMEVVTVETIVMMPMIRFILQHLRFAMV